uniref:BRO1 domain-containing protein n=1 Tax=Ciona savignyi TaxID=51511 RepID=H2YCD8_CIOSA
MEAVPRLPMLKVNMKDNQEYSGWFYLPFFLNHIRECYSDDPEKYRDCIAKFLELHLAAYKVIPAPDFDGCNTLKKYFGQLHYMQSRFPFYLQTCVGKQPLNSFFITLTWSLSMRTLIKKDACHSLSGACHSILGQMDNRVSEEGTKTSCVHFQCSAGMFQYLSNNLDTTLSYDSSQLMLKLMINTMLVRKSVFLSGRWCFNKLDNIIHRAKDRNVYWEKSMQDNRKDSIVAKISQQVVDYYKVALTSLNSAEAKDIMGDSLNKSWLKLVSFKTAFYAAVARYYAGCSSWDQERYGEGVGYLVSALQYYEQAVKAAKSLKGDVKNQVEKALKYSSDIFNGRYNGAKKDNEFIYHERVVDAALLPDIKGASLVKALPFEPSNQMVTGPDIFAKLIPMEAHLVASSYSEEKAKLLRPIVTEQDEKDAILEQYKQSIELDPDKLIKLDDADQLDPVLIEHCASLSVDQTPITKLTSSMKELSDLYMDVETVIEETIEIIEDEELETNQVKDVCGKTVDSSDEVSKIKADLEVCKDVHKEAWKINDDLSTAMKVHIANLRTVSRGLDAVRKECQLMDIA